ncbi:TRAP transporter substrate-binding protein [Fodinicurvata halophila]|uniref:TRAP transporter substrate-binding protein n=1 Tax=Fodinicurvata halophila TaxID=1419723 RepID=A0ABV8UNM8_9PROT
MSTKTLTSLLAVGALTLGAQQAAAQSMSLDLANEYPAGSVHGQSAEIFADTLERLSGGDIEINLHHGASLGYKSADQFDAVGDGALPLASSFIGPWAGIDELFLLSSLPFLASTPEQVWDLYQVAKPYYKEVLQENNQVFLYATPWPPSGLWGNKALDSMDALEDTRIRTYDSSGTVTLREAGADPIQLSWADVVPQLSTGGIDGVLTSADGGASASLWENQSHFTEVNYASPLQVMHMNRDTYESLSDEQKDMLDKASAAGEAYGWWVLPRRQQENYAKMRDQGMTVIEDVSDEYLNSLNEAAQPAIEEWRSEMDDRGEEILEAYEARLEE